MDFAQYSSLEEIYIAKITSKIELFISPDNDDMSQIQFLMGLYSESLTDIEHYYKQQVLCLWNKKNICLPSNTLAKLNIRAPLTFFGQWIKTFMSNVIVAKNLWKRNFNFLGGFDNLFNLTSSSLGLNVTTFNVSLVTDTAQNIIVIFDRPVTFDSTYRIFYQSNINFNLGEFACSRYSNYITIPKVIQKYIVSAPSTFTCYIGTQLSNTLFVNTFDEFHLYSEIETKPLEYVDYPSAIQNTNPIVIGVKKVPVNVTKIAPLFKTKFYSTSANLEKFLGVAFNDSMNDNIDVMSKINIDLYSLPLVEFTENTTFGYILNSDLRTLQLSQYKLIQPINILPTLKCENSRQILSTPLTERVLDPSMFIYIPIFKDFVITQAAIDNYIYNQSPAPDPKLQWTQFLPDYLTFWNQV